MIVGRQARLLFQGLHGEREVLINAGTAFTIGRQARCSLVVLRPSVSRLHAKIIYESGIFYVEDLGSSNGTFRNNESIKRVPLEDGDEIRCGDMRFLFRLKPSNVFSCDAPTIPCEAWSIDAEAASSGESMGRVAAPTSGVRPARSTSSDGHVSCCDLESIPGPMVMENEIGGAIELGVPIVAQADSFMPLGTRTSRSDHFQFSADPAAAIMAHHSASEEARKMMSPEVMRATLAAYEAALAERDLKIADLEAQLEIARREHT